MLFFIVQTRDGEKAVVRFPVTISPRTQAQTPNIRAAPETHHTTTINPELPKRAESNYEMLPLLVGELSAEGKKLVEFSRTKTQLVHFFDRAIRADGTIEVEDMDINLSLACSLGWEVFWGDIGVGIVMPASFHQGLDSLVVVDNKFISVFCVHDSEYI